MYIDNLYISHYILCIQLYVYIYICTVVYIRIKSWKNGPGWQVPRQVGGKPSLHPGIKWCDLRPRNDDKPLDLDGKCCGGWCTFVTPGHTPCWVQTVPQLWDSTRPRTCISALSFLTLLRPGLIHGRARERALDPNLTSFRNYEPRKSLQFAHEAFQSNGAHFGTLSSNCQLTSHLALFIISTWSVMVPWFPTTLCRFQHGLALVFKCWDILYINFACGVPFQSRDCEAVCANLGASNRSKLTMLGQTFWIQISIWCSQELLKSKGISLGHSRNGPPATNYFACQTWSAQSFWANPRQAASPVGTN